MGWNMRIERGDKDVMRTKNKKQRIVNKANAKRKDCERGDRLSWTMVMEKPKLKWRKRNQR